jgi:hypothetical protein
MLLGRTIDVNGKLYVVDSLRTTDGKTFVRASADIDGVAVERDLPAEFAFSALVVDEEIEIRGVSFA